jgi:hypothetical protein
MTIRIDKKGRRRVSPDDPSYDRYMSGPMGDAGSGTRREGEKG